MVMLSIQPLEDRIVLDGAIAHDVIAPPTAQAAVVAPPSDSHSPQNQLVIIAENIKDASVLRDAIREGTNVVAYDPNTATLESLSAEIHNILNGSQVESIVVVTDGKDGQFNLLANQSVNSQTLESQAMADFWRGISNNLLPNGSVNILGCNVASTDLGVQFLHKLDGILSDTGKSINVNASTDLTGSSALNGNWTLEFSTNSLMGDVDAGSLYFEGNHQLGWNHTLAPGFTVTPTSGLTFNESGQGSFSIVLDSQPTANVTISGMTTTLGFSVLTLSTTSLTFTTVNWATPQVVTVTGIPDTITQANRNFTITTPAATSSDGSYNGLNPSDITGTLVESSGGERNFSSQYSTNAHGDIILTGNSILTTSSTPPIGDNNNQNLIYIDIDGNGATFNSSSADINLPANSTILFAGLYWGGRTDGPTAPLNVNLRGQVLFKTPTSNYVTVFADQIDHSTALQGTSFFNAFTDVTSLVAAGGNGTFTVGNIQVATGSTNTAGQAGGWTLVIAYANASENLRNMVVYDGFKGVSAGNLVTQVVTGFQTPVAGPLDTKVGMVALEGDKGLVGDYFKIGGAALGDAIRTGNAVPLGQGNFFMSAITDLGSFVTARNPSWNDLLGYDIARVDADGLFTNNQTSATLQFTSSGDLYAPAVLTFSTTLYSADVTPVKTVSNITAPSPNTQYFSGDVVQYTIVATNNGTDFGDNTIITDVLPSNVTYVPGTLRIGGILKTDAAGDDQAEYNLGTNTITYRIGSGATSSIGGTLITTQSVTVTYEATINAVGGGTVISNTADATSTTRSLGFTATNTSAAANLTVTATPTFTVSSPSIAEGNSGTTNLTFNITMSAAAGRTMNVYYNTQDNTALVSDSDYNPVTATLLSFVPGQTSKTVQIGIIGDLKFETNETFFVQLANTIGGAVVAQGTGTILNDDTVPSISVNNTSATRGDPLNFTVSLDRPTYQVVTVNIATADGTATLADNDYTQIPLTLITFNPGVTSIIVPVSTTAQFQPQEIMYLNLSGATNVGPNPWEVGIGTLNANGLPTVSIDSVTNFEGNAGTTNYVFTITLSAASATPVTVDYHTVDGTATTVDNDYNEVLTTTITFNPSDPLTQTITITVNGDTKLESDETFTVVLDNAVGASVSGGPGVGTIQNDDATPSMSITVSNITAEGSTGNVAIAVYTVSLSNASDQPITVDYETTDGTATVTDNDYVGIPLSTLTFNPGELTKTIEVIIIGDNKYETNETYTVDLSNPVGATLANNQGAGVILNDDAIPTIIVADVNQFEGDSGTSPMTFTITLSNPSYQDITVSYSTTNGTATVLDNDYLPATGTLTILAGDTQAIFTVLVVGDNTYEADQTFTATVTSDDVPLRTANASVTATGTILNDDAIPTVIVSSTAQNEGNIGNTPITITITLSNPSFEDITVSYTTTDGTALVSDSDYLATSGSVTILAGTTQQTFNVQIVGDLKLESDEIFTVDATVTGGTTTNLTASGTEQITNDDAVPTVTIANVSLAEGGTGTNNTATFTATLSNPSDQDTVISYSTTDGTAIAGTDYTTATGSITILAGTTQATFDVLFIGNNTIEANKTFNVTGTVTSGVTANPTAGAVGTILNDDISFTITDVQMAEGNTGATPNFIFTVTLSGNPANNVDINYTTNDGTAFAGTDYTANSGILHFTTGGPLSQNITVLGIGNLLVELNKLFTVDLTTTSANVDVIASDVQGVGTILNDDTTNITIGNASHAEGTGEDAFTMDFIVTISNPIAYDVTVTYTTADGTALVSDSDYTPVTVPITITFTAGGPLSQTISIAITADNKLEQNENFVVNLANASSGAAIVQGQGVGDILNDDGIQISVNNVSLTEGNAGNSNMTFTVSLSAATDVTIQVDYQTFDGTISGLAATLADSDYFSTNGTLIFLPGGALSQTVNVLIRGDINVELNENLTLQLSNPINAALNPNASAGTGTIINDDANGGTTVITTVWRDLNGNGVRDINENGMYNITVRLYQASVPGTPVSTGYTDTNGTVAFVNLVPSTYFLQWDIIPGHSITVQEVSGGLTASNDSDAIAAFSTSTVAQSRNFTVVANTVNSNVSAGLIYYSTTQGGQIGDFVFNDINHNGVQDPGDLGIPNVAVTLFGNATVAGANVTVPLRTVLTDANGFYLFDGLSPTSSVITGTNPDIVFVVDVSGSTQNSFGGSPVGDVNNDGRFNTILDGELASFKVLVNELINDGFGSIARVSLVKFSSSAATINAISLGGTSVAATPDQWIDSLTGNFRPAAQTLINSLFSNGGTNYKGALQQATNVFNTLGSIGPNGNLIFLSDGRPDTGNNYTAEANNLRITKGYTTTAIGVGSGAPLAPLQIIDPNAFVVTNTNQLLDFFQGTLQSTEYILNNYFVKFDLPSDRIFSPQNTTSIGLDSDPNPITGETNTFTLGTNEHKLTIDAGMTQILISIDNVSQNEGNAGTTVYTFTATLNFAQTSTVSVEYQTNDGTATTADSDYVLKTGTLIFNPNVTSQTFTVNVNGDLKYETNEQFTTSLLNAINAAISSAPNQGVGTIVNDDATPTVSISDTDGGVTPGEASTVEGNVGANPTINFTVTLSNPSYQDIVLWFYTTDGTATLADSDYVQVIDGAIPVTIFAGTTQSTFNVTLNGDTKYETDETLTVTMTVQSGDVSNGGVITATGTIINDDSPPTVTISPSTVNEGNLGNTPMNFDVQLSNTSYQDIVITFSTVDGTALVSDSDYTPQTNATITILSGQTQGTLVVNATGDTKFELDEAYTVNADVTSGTITGSTSMTVTGTIVNDDAPPTISLSQPVPVLEGNSGITTIPLTITLSNTSYQDITFTIITVDGSAKVADNDFTGIPLTTITILSGQTTALISTDIIGDTKYELDETYTLSGNVTNGTVSGSTAFNSTITIVNDDNAPTITFRNNGGTPTPTITGSDGDPNPPPVDPNGFSFIPIDSSGTPVINAIQVKEGNSGLVEMTFYVQLSNTTYQDITFGVSTLDGIIIAAATLSDHDFINSTGQTNFTILSGETEGSFRVYVQGDTKFEAHEFFQVRTDISNGATVSGPTFLKADAQIVNDDFPPNDFVIPPTTTPTVVIPTPSQTDSMNLSQTTLGLLGVESPSVNMKPNFSPLSDIVVTDLDEKGVFKIYLTTKPSEPVTIDLKAAGLPENSLSINKVTFTPENWNEPQQIKVRIQDTQTSVEESPVEKGNLNRTTDDDTTARREEEEMEAKIITQPAQSDDPDYNGIKPKDVKVFEHIKELLKNAQNDDDEETQTTEAAIEAPVEEEPVMASSAAE
jgi:hypothetical protein